MLWLDYDLSSHGKHNSSLIVFYLFDRALAGVGRQMIPFQSFLNSCDKASVLYADNLLDIPDDSVAVKVMLGSLNFNRLS